MMCECSRCYKSVHVNPEHEWSKGDVCWPCQGEEIDQLRATIADQEREIVRLRRNKTDDPIVKLNRILDGVNSPLSCGHPVDCWDEPEGTEECAWCREIARAEKAEAEVERLKTIAGELTAEAELWLVVRICDHQSPEIYGFKSWNEAEVFYDQASAQWTNTYFCSIIRGPDRPGRMSDAAIRFNCERTLRLEKAEAEVERLREEKSLLRGVIVEYYQLHDAEGCDVCLLCLHAARALMRTSASNEEIAKKARLGCMYRPDHYPRCLCNGCTARSLLADKPQDPLDNGGE